MTASIDTKLPSAPQPQSGLATSATDPQSTTRQPDANRPHQHALRKLLGRGMLDWVF